MSSESAEHPSEYAKSKGGTPVSRDEPLDNDDGEVMVAFEAPGDGGARTVRLGRVRWWRSTGVSLVASVVLHGGLIIVLVRAGVLRVPASISLQGGVVGAPGIEGLGVSAVATRGATAAALPESTVPEIKPVELGMMQIGSEVAAAEVLPKDPAELLNVRTAGWIGLPGAKTGMDLSGEFPHRYPAGWQGGNPGGAAQSVAVESTARAGGGGGGGNGGDGGGGKPVASARNKRPAYPAEARRRGYEGTVWLRIEIREDGSVGEVSVDESSGHEILDRAAVDAVRTWHFTPAMEDGRPVRSEPRQPIVFSLHG